MYFSIWLFFAINCRPKLNEGNLYLFSFNSLWLPLCINSTQVARDTVPVDTNVDESTLKSTSMVLVSVELPKKKKNRSTLTRFELFQRSQSKWIERLKILFFFYQVPFNGLLRYIVVCVFFLQCRLLRIAHGSPMKAFHCLNITRLICKRCTNDGFIIMTWYLKINCMKDILVHIASAEPLTMHEHQILQ